jgi:salicylate hydroxylase
VVGGGIGGLTAALSLLEVGLDVQVFEQAATFSDVGAGVQVSPNASCVLHGLGLADALATMGVRPLAFHQRRWDDGRTLLRAPLGDVIVEAFGFPHYQTHRADLVSALVGALPPERLHVKHRLVGLAQSADGVVADFENGARVDVDLLVGADGIHSFVREALFGQTAPHFTGCVAYRGLVPAERLRDLELEVSAELWLGPGGHFIHYFVQNKRLVNFVAVTEQDSWMRESWVDRGDLSDALAAYAGWHPQVSAILGAVDESFVWALFDREPLERWVEGRIALLGDACHPMLPFMAQGAAQAIEDGATLAACLADAVNADLTRALSRYETLRQPRANRVQAMSAVNKTRFHLPDGPEQLERDTLMASGSTDFSVDAIAWLYGHNARQLTTN